MPVLVTLHTLLNAIICCFQLNTEWGADANRKVDYLGIDAVGLRSMYFVVMPNRNHREHLGMFCIVMPSIFVNCPAVICLPNMLVICSERDTTSELWTLVQFPHTVYTTCCNHLFPVTCCVSCCFPHHTFNSLFLQDRRDWQPLCFVLGKVLVCVCADSTLVQAP